MADRVWLIRRLCLIGLGIVLLRLADLQLRRGFFHRHLAEQNRLRLVPEPAPRGVILDREGRELAGNRMIFRIAAVPQELKDRQALFAKLAPLVQLAPVELEKRFQQERNLPFLPAALTWSVPKSTALRVEEERLDLPGIIVESVTARQYPMGAVASNLLGYLSQPSPEALPALKSYGVQPRDLVGRAGLERELDDALRGRPGGSLIEVDHRARQMRVIGHREPVPGKPVMLTIDAALQRLIEQSFGEQAGAAVVLDPWTGELLAMVSSPGFDPGAFVTQDNAAIRRFLNDPAAPLMNRAAVGVYAPGSIMKPLIALLGVQHRVITPQTPVTCRGYITIGDRQFHCWNRDGHGEVDLRRALMVSCNVYFMELGRRLGLERIRTGFAGIGFGKPTGWPMEERPGHLPFHRQLTEGEVAMLAIGQGEILMTPLQIAVYAAALANRGKLVQPWLVARIGEHAMPPPRPTPLDWDPEAVRAVREGMLASVNGPEGTGIHAHSDAIRIAGKTGTAQTHLPGQTHGWFIGFCPEAQPVAAMAIVAEYGGSGGDVPARIGKAVCEYLAAQHRS